MNLFSFVFIMKKVIHLDNIDEQILGLLSKNSRLTNKEIGKIVHLSGQAVGIRILQLQEKKIIKNFSINIEYSQTQFIRIFMDTNKFTNFEKHVNSFSEVESLFKTTGQACYVIISHFKEKQLGEFAESLSEWGRYSVESVIGNKSDTTIY